MFYAQCSVLSLLSLYLYLFNSSFNTFSLQNLGISLDNESKLFQQTPYHSAMVPSLVNVAYGRDVSFEDVMRMGAVSTVGAWGANEIGGGYLDKDVHYWGHKALHYGLGFGMGAALDPRDWVKAGISGGSAAMVSEVLAEATEMPFFSKAIGTIAGSLIIEGADPMAAMLIARNAVENNFEYSKMMELFEDRTGLSDLGETWEDRVEQERLVQGAYTGFRSSLVGKAEGVAGTPGKVAVDFLMPSHHNLIVPELMMNISGAAAGVKFVIKAPKYAPNLLRMAPKAFDVTKGFLRNFISPRQLVKTLPKKDAAQMIAKRNVKGRLTSVSHTQKHHIIHQSLKDHELIQLANFNIHNPANIMLLPTKTGAKLTTTSRAVHQGRHTDEVVRALRISMNKVAEVGKAVGYTQEQYKQALLRIIAGERLELKMGLKSL